MKVVIISCSLNPGSRSNVLANLALDHLQRRNIEGQLLDLRRHSLLFCDGTSASKNEDAVTAAVAIKQANAVLMAVPIYNFDVNAAAKNVVEVTGGAWNDKVVGFMCAAGGRASYMSVMGLANSLMLDFRCFIVPRFVYATKGDFTEVEAHAKVLHSEQVRTRLNELVEMTIKITQSLTPLIS